jgi:hypothetical protein
LKQIVLGYAERRGPASIPYDPKQLQQALRRGMDGVSQRLARIEEQLERLLNPERADAPGVDQASVDATIAARIEELLGE